MFLIHVINDKQMLDVANLEAAESPFGSWICTLCPWLLSELELVRETRCDKTEEKGKVLGPGRNTARGSHKCNKKDFLTAETNSSLSIQTGSSLGGLSLCVSQTKDVCRKISNKINTFVDEKCLTCSKLTAFLLIFFSVGSVATLLFSSLTACLPLTLRQYFRNTDHIC